MDRRSFLALCDRAMMQRIGHFTISEWCVLFTLASTVAAIIV